MKKGWEVKNIDRARQSILKNDICLSYLLGSKDKIFMMLKEKTENIVITNGLYRVRIEDEETRVSFFAFLFSKSFQIQFEAFSTGSIQTNMVLERVWDFKFPLLNEEERKKWKDYIFQISELKKRSKLLCL
jgi:type I restriction enzyme M protein